MEHEVIDDPPGIGTVLRTGERKDKITGFDSRTGIPVHCVLQGRLFTSGRDGSLSVKHFGRLSEYKCIGKMDGSSYSGHEGL